MSTPATTTPATSVRTGLTHLLSWLTTHGEINLVSVTYLDGSFAELDLPVGEAETLRAARMTADALDGASVEVNDPHGRGVTTVAIAGTAGGDGGAIPVLAVSTVVGAARAALLGALDVPVNPKVRTWYPEPALLHRVAADLAAAQGAPS